MVENTDVLPKPATPPMDDHKLTFGVVYANEIAVSEIDKEKPRFRVGSIIVRERNATEFSTTPMTVIAMVKQAEGFSKETGDWEFFVLRGTDLSLQTRMTKGECSSCHTKATKSDWVFRDFLK